MAQDYRAQLSEYSASNDLSGRWRSQACHHSLSPSGVDERHVTLIEAGGEGSNAGI